ncbi:RHS repeat protein [Paenibacillus sp. PsM32]|uniref:RHS repeat domain-containing protein n=1 Tax=unclassified Paenibacillus TaxID=185978 RepID=UPI00263AA25C|nr:MULTISPECIES: RHS repeat domain-containing protein [unclassified Paenibacillus]MDN4620972.1 RHS repeat protein [Paenibacillus sp. PsM32]MDQ1232528.1 YD repeat-containing protein [Paenibacillus sp. SORGH_AS_0306]MDR6109578.1 YD repeat-containing protein [Paenibacillus sp. SORGH_AS_0338]
MRKISTMIVLSMISMLLTAPLMYAAEYQYDDLGRVTSVTKDGKQTIYTYDQGGNLLSVTSNTNSKSLRQASNVIAGWTAYTTKGIKASYRTATEDVYAPIANMTPQSVVHNVYSDTTVASDVYHSSSSMMNTQWIDVSSKRTGGANIYRDIPVKAGQTYSYNGWVQSNNVKDAVVQVIINYYDKNNKLVHYNNILNLKQNSDWHTYGANLKAPAKAVKARVHLQIVLLKSKGTAQAGFADRTFEQTTQEDNR